MAPSLGSNGVLLLGEALGADEEEQGKPFVGKAGFRLTRMIEWAGFKREDFSIANAVWCRPPDNKLEGTPFEAGAVAHCREAYWQRMVDAHRVIVPLGNVPTAALLGFKGILQRRGYPYQVGSHVVIPTLHPSFIQRGQAKWTAAVINDLQKAVSVATSGYQPIFKAYTLDPSPLEALRWAEEFERDYAAGKCRYLSFDIETPGKSEDEDELDDEGKDQTWRIERIGFSYRAHHALSVPFEPLYFAAIRKLLSAGIEKVVWNAGFDVPRLRRAGFDINGIIHDGMVAWHILHSDLPKRLACVATFTCPEQTAWKHLSGAQPAFYNATDADVELRSMEAIERDLRGGGLWDVYQRDVLDLEPVLHAMEAAGMPVDEEVRAESAVKLAAELGEVASKMTAAVPLGARKVAHVYQRPPATPIPGLHSRPGIRTVRVCPGCGQVGPRKDHFKTFKRKSNPCAGLIPESRDQVVEEYYRLAEFTPSRDQLIRLHEFLRRPIPMVLDKKTRKRKPSFGEKQLRELILRHGDDPLYELILRYRALDKLAGTYIGRPVNDPR